jgi:hypothetical protein
MSPSSGRPVGGMVAGAGGVCKVGITERKHPTMKQSATVLADKLGSGLKSRPVAPCAQGGAFSAKVS